MIGRRALAELWEPDDGPPAPFAPPFTVVVLLALLALAVRRPDAVTSPQFWAEDGYTFFQDQHCLGFREALLRPWHGYVHLLPRLVAGLAALLPIVHAPRVYATAGLVVGALACAWIARGEFRRVIPDDRLRVLAAVAIACAPTGRELIGCLANVNWYLLWLGLLLALAPFPSRGRAAFLGLNALVALSTPGAVAYLPLWGLRAWARPAERRLVAGCVLPVAVGLALMRFEGTGWTRAPLAAGDAALGVARLFAWRVVAEPFTGEGDRLMAAERLGLLAPAAAGLAIVAAACLAFKGSDARGRAWLVLVLAGALGTFALTCFARREVVRIASVALTTRGGGRYFFVPVAAIQCVFFAALARTHGAERLLARTLVAAVVLGCAVTFRARPFRPLDWPGHARRIEEARAAGATVTFEVPINPSPEKLVVRLVRGVPAAVGSD